MKTKNVQSSKLIVPTAGPMADATPQGSISLLGTVAQTSPTLASATVNTAAVNAVQVFEAALSTAQGPLYVFITQIAALLQKYPSLDPDTNPADILAGKAASDAMSAGSAVVIIIAHDMNETSRVIRSVTWGRCSGVLGSAKSKAKNNKLLANDLAAIRTALKTGPRVDTAAKTVAETAAKEQKAAENLVKAQQRSADAVASQSRATAASLAHGTGDAVITQAAPDGTPTRARAPVVRAREVRARPGHRPRQRAG